jgi:hypothetical protein
MEESATASIRELDCANSAQSDCPNGGAAVDRRRIEAFGRALDALRKEVEADLGERDVAYMRRVRSASRRLELTGRGLIHFSRDGISGPVPRSWGALRRSSDTSTSRAEPQHPFDADYELRHALGTITPVGRVLQRKDVHEGTWDKILMQLSAPRITRMQSRT